MKWCRADTFVLEIIDFDPAGRYDPSLIWYDCPDEVQPGWVRNPDNTYREAVSADHYPNLDDYKEFAYEAVEQEAQTRQLAAESNPSVGVTLNDNARLRKNKQRDNKAKKKNNGVSDADDHLLDHIDQINDSGDLLNDQVEDCSTHACIDAVLADVSNDTHWPVWTPI